MGIDFDDDDDDDVILCVSEAKRDMRGEENRRADGGG